MGRLTTEQDHEIGARIRERRTILGLTQNDLGDAAGTTGQQIMKYEKGLDRVAGTRLQAIARRLGCNVTDLLGGEEIADPHQRETMNFMRNYLALPKIQQRALRRYVETLVAGSR